MTIESARVKLEKEASSCGALEKAIASYLSSIMDDELAALVDRPDYTVKEMGGFVMAKARKELNGQSGALADEVVYGFATDYYHATRDEIRKNGTVSTAGKAPNNVTTNKPKAEKKPEKKDEKAEKPAAPKSTTLNQAKKTGPDGQVSLFDLLGGLADA